MVDLNNAIIAGLTDEHFIDMAIIQAKAALPNGSMGDAFQEALANEGFRKSFVDLSLNNKEAFDELTSDPSVANNEMMKGIKPALDDPENLQYLRENPDTAYEMADPDNWIDPKDMTAINAKLPSNAQAQVAPVAPIEVAAQTAQALTDQQLADQQLAEEHLAAQISAEQNLEPNNEVIAPTAETEAVAVTQTATKQPEMTNIEIGAKFTTDIGALSAIGVSAQAKVNITANVQNLTANNPELMEAIGADYSKNKAEIQTSLTQISGGTPEQKANAFESMMKDHPEVMQAVIPIAAAADPVGMGENAMDAMGSMLKEGLADKNGVIPDDMKGAAADIDTFVANMKNSPGAMEYLGNQLADVETSGQLLTNIETLASSAGSPERMKMVMDDMTNNPTEVMDMMASPMMMAYAQQRYADDVMGKMDLNTSGIQKNLSDMAGSEGAEKLKSLTGIDMKGMLGKLSKNLPGLEDQMQGFMQHYGSMASMNMLSFNATSSWMGGFGGGDMSMGGDMFGNLMGQFKSFGAGMGISNYAQARMTDGLGNVRVKEYDNWIEGQKDMIADNKVNEKTGQVTKVETPSGTKMTATDPDDNYRPKGIERDDPSPELSS